jgi:hypothetical protein
MRVSRFGTIAVFATAMVAAPALAGSVTVGRFYAQLAQAKQLVAADAASAEANLRSAGFNLPRLALDKSLTEGDLTAISDALGVSVTTQRPSQVVSEASVNTYFSVFAGKLRAPAPGSIPLSTNSGDNDDQGDDNDDQGKPKSKHKPN